ncbi:MAG: hypothetical protein ACYTAO_09230 [Planctomycetota bacterium]|jgi:hypothetical protein
MRFLVDKRTYRLRVEGDRASGAEEHSPVIDYSSDSNMHANTLGSLRRPIQARPVGPERTSYLKGRIDFCIEVER